MSIRKRKWSNGKEAWQVDLVVRRKRRRAQFATKAEAKAFELEMLKRAHEGTYLADGSKVSLADLVPDFLSNLERRYERGASMTAVHLKSQRGHLKNYILGGVPIRYGRGHKSFGLGLGYYKLEDISPDVIEEFLERLLDFGRSVKTVREIRNTLTGLLDHARRKKYIAQNPARGAKLLISESAKRKRKVVPPPKSLIHAIIKVAADRDKLPIKFAVLTGLRASEQWALRWHHIDFKNGVIIVETRVDEMTKTESVTKTEAGTRHVPVSLSLLRELSSWRERSEFSGLMDLVFPNFSGTYHTHGNVRRRLYQYYEAAIRGWPEGEPVPGRPRWHDLRHFAISSWIAAGLMPKAIQEFAGHASLQMTMDRYGHLFPSENHQHVMDNVEKGVFAERVRTGNGTEAAHEDPPSA